MKAFYEMDDVDRELMKVVRKAVKYEAAGHPAKDAIDYDEMLDALRLLVEIVDAGFAK
jgi:hypothetical protein